MLQPNISFQSRCYCRAHTFPCGSDNLYTHNAKATPATTSPINPPFLRTDPVAAAAFALTLAGPLPIPTVPVGATLPALSTPLAAGVIITLPVAIMSPVSVTLVSASVRVAVPVGRFDAMDVTSSEDDVVLVFAAKFGRNDGVTVAVPVYPAQPGTVVFGGARPPPQSRKLQISPVPGT